jgi:hypothetical protein
MFFQARVSAVDKHKGITLLGVLFGGGFGCHDFRQTLTQEKE